MERLRRKYEIEGIVVSDVSEELKKKYSELKIYDLMEQEKLFELMREADIFLYPGSVDTFGFSLLEAMSFGLPILTINTERTRSRREIVKNEKTGFILEVGKERC
jgi:glycosyltransferase involved in cell wall biosynthesis